MNLGVRGHDVPSESAELLCQKLCQLGLREIQLVAHKSFPDFPYGKEAVAKLAETLNHYGIRVAIYGCYVDPLAEAGKARFLEHIEYFLFGWGARTGCGSWSGKLLCATSWISYSHN